MKTVKFIATALVCMALVSLTCVPSFAQKFAYVNTEYILENVPEYKEAQKQLDALSVQWQREIEVKFSEVDKLYKAFQAEQILLTEDLKRKREQEIINKEKEAKDLQKQRFGVNGDLFKKRQDLVKPTQERVFNAVKKMAETGNYAFIFDKTSDALTMLYANAKYDKSDDILNAMGIKPGQVQKPKPGGGSGITNPTEMKPSETKPGKDEPAEKKDPKN